MQYILLFKWKQRDKRMPSFYAERHTICMGELTRKRLIKYLTGTSMKQIAEEESVSYTTIRKNLQYSCSKIAHLFSDEVTVKDMRQYKYTILKILRDEVYTRYDK